MRVFFKFILAFLVSTLLLITLIVGGLFYSFTDSQPKVISSQKTKVADIQRIKQLFLSRNHQRDNNDYAFNVSQRDINLGLNHFLPTTSDLKNVSAKVKIKNDKATINATVKIDGLPWRHYINLRWQIFENDEKLSIGPLSIGKITLSQNMSQQIFDYLLTLAKKNSRASQGLRAWESISGVDLHENNARIRYQRNTMKTMTLDDYESLIVSGSDKALSQQYTEMIQALPQHGPLIEFLQPLFARAKNRSITNGKPIAENRALLLALGKHFGGEQLVNLIEQGQLPSARHMKTRFTVHRRRDLAQHFIVSAGLTVVSSGELAEAIGVDKEISDLKIGSVISAWDLLADRAGVRLAQRATYSAKEAFIVQEVLADINHDIELLPDLGRSFSGQNDQFAPDDLNDLMTMIDLSLDQLKLYQR